ncbi:DUF4258 domain-containing protein [Ectothiorhodospiraceae bacterium BW-2]|nr:DUF4258 domain-containing protein [Ectothiorhodospiraceae bacterium BW-2]
MSDSFYSPRYHKTVWLTDHAIEAMSKRNIRLSEMKELIEQGEYRPDHGTHGWIHHHFTRRADNLICAAVATAEAIIVKTVMIHWQLRE